MENFKNILVIRTDRIGDVVLTVPAVRALKQAFPRARVTLWVREATRDLVEHLPWVDKVIVENTARGWSGYWDIVSLMREMAFDLVVNFHPKRRTNAACFLAGVPLRLGYRNSKFGFLLNRPVLDGRHLGERHEAEYCLELLRAIGVVSTDTSLELSVSSDAEKWVEQFLETHKLKGNPIFLFHPDASDSTKCWPHACFGKLAQRLAERYSAQPIFVGGMTARAHIVAIGEEMTCDYHDLTGSLSLAQLTSLLRRSQLLVSNDSGPVHMAAAVKIPVISLFLRVQPGINPQRWRPLGERSVVLFNKPGEEIIVNADSQLVSGKFDSITVDEVFAKACELIDSTLSKQAT